MMLAPPFAKDTPAKCEVETDVEGARGKKKAHGAETNVVVGLRRR